MKSIVLSVSSLLVLSAAAQAQAWVQSVTQEVEVQAARILPSGEHVVLGRTPSQLLPRIELYGATGSGLGTLQLAHPAGGGLMVHGFEVQSDGSLLLVGGYDNRAWLSSLNPSTGAFAWETLTIEAPYSGSFDHVSEGPNAIFAAGTMDQFGAESNGFLAAHDGQGAVLWQRLIGPFTESSRVEGLVATDDGGVLVLTYADEPTGASNYLLKLSASGTLEWSVEPHPSLGRVFLERASDATVLLGASVNSGGTRTWLQKMEQDGTVLWQRFVADAIPEDMQPTADGGAVFMGRVSLFPTMVRVDASGNTLWNKKLASGPSIFTDGAVAAYPDGGVFGAWTAPDVIDVNYLARCDPAGSVQVGCGSDFFALPASSESAIQAAALATVEVNNWLGGSGSGSTAVSSAVLSAQPFCGDPCQPMAYCETSPNSVTAGARINYNGSTSMFANNLSLVTTGLPAGSKGLYFFGSQPTNKPFGNGVLCVGGPKRRLPIVSADAQGLLTYGLDLTNPNAAAITLGSTWYFQCWYRDPQGGGNGTNLSDALTTVWCP